MSKANTNDFSGLQQVILLRNLTRKAETFNGEPTTRWFSRFLRLKTPQLNDGILTMKPYDPTWADLYRVETTRIQTEFSAHGIPVTAAAHVGSTAIPGQASNNIIDLAVVFPDSDRLEKAKAILIKMGYDNYGNSPMGPNTEWLWRVKTGESQGDRAYALHVDTNDNHWFQSNLDFRGYMSSHRENRESYNALKKEIGHLKKENLLIYTLKKMELVMDIYTEAHQWAKNQDTDKT